MKPQLVEASGYKISMKTKQNGSETKNSTRNIYSGIYPLMLNQ